MPSTSKPEVKVTPELAKALAQYAGTTPPEEAMAGAVAILQHVVDVLGEVDVASLRYVEPAYIQPLRREVRRRRT